MQFKSVFTGCDVCGGQIQVDSILPKNANSPVCGARYFMALIQEMAVKIDQDFLAATLALFTPVTDTQADRQKVKASWSFLGPLFNLMLEHRAEFSRVTFTNAIGGADVWRCCRIQRVT